MASTQWWLTLIIVSYCLVDWLTGLWLHRTARARLALAVGIGFNLLVLCFWKYTPLLVETTAVWLGWNAIPTQRIASGNWIIPMGISFYAFTGIAYMVEVYRGTIAAETNLWHYSLFTSFFPHLVAGPILRPSEFLVHLQPGLMPTRPLDPAEATFLIARGFFKKLVLADSIAVAVDPFFANISHPSTAGVWSLPYPDRSGLARACAFDLLHRQFSRHVKKARRNNENLEQQIFLTKNLFGAPSSKLGSVDEDASSQGRARG